MTDQLADEALLLAAGWLRHSTSDTWALPTAPSNWRTTDMATRAQLRAQGWTRMDSGSWLAPGGKYALAHLDAVCRTALADLGATPSGGAAAVSGPTPDIDPPVAPEPAEADSVRAQLLALDRDDTSGILAFVLRLVSRSSRRHEPVMMGDQRTPRVRMATMLGVLLDYDEALQAEQQMPPRADVLRYARAMAVLDAAVELMRATAAHDDGTTEAMDLRRAVAEYLGEEPCDDDE